jgi:hypothetical protein
MARAMGVFVGLVAPWVRRSVSRGYRRLPSACCLPPAVQKLEVGADIAGHRENMPPAVLVDSATVALGHRLTVAQRLRASG